MGVTTARQDEELRSRFAALLAAAREEYAAEAGGGREVLARYADRMDGLVREIAQSAQAQTPTPLVVCALGGYGRRALCLHSDIDLLVLFHGPIGRPEERYVNALLQPLWDLRLTVGHQIRELSEFEEFEITNAEFLLALLDARLLAGDDNLFARLLAWLRGTGEERTRQLLKSLLLLVRERHDRFNDTIYQLEPDVKDAPGALRDIAAIRTVRSLAPDPFDGHDLTDSERLDEAEDLLLRIRSVLHLESGRNLNVLSHDLQEKVAELLAYPGQYHRQRVEALMSEYFRRARAVARSLEWSRKIVEPPAQPIRPRRIGGHLELATDGVRFSDVARAASMPAVWLEAFRVALAHECGVSEQARSCIERNVGRYTADDFVVTEGDRQQLRHLLDPRPGLYARLSEMHDCGLLGCIFPEFDKIHSRVVRDFYHRYTVDEHTLLAIRNLESLRTATTAGRQRFSAMLQELHAPELLTLALLFHDVGKCRDEEHVEQSVRMAQPMLDRLQMPAEARQTISFLIRHHLQMSHVAFRRDSEDPEVVAQFAALVGTEEQLKMLCLMTLADIGAVSPDTLTPWKEELLWRLYVDTYNRLTFGYADELIQKDQAGLAVVMAGRPDDISDVELTRFLNGLPRRYLALFGLGTIYSHVRLARGLRADEVHASLEKHGDVWELAVVTLDKPYLFSNISGVLSYFGMDIHRGQAMTTPDGLVLDVFEFSDEEGFLRQNPGGTAEMYRTLDAVVAGSLDVPTLLRGKERSVLYRRRRRVAPLVYLDNEYSRKYTVLEIIADDALGLLYRISRAVSRQGCDLDLVLISTEGKKAIDVLHVTKHGRKLAASDQITIKQELERVLEDNHEAH